MMGFTQEPNRVVTTCCGVAIIAVTMCRRIAIIADKINPTLIKEWGLELDSISIQ